jgi:hypothetical protein
MDHHLESLQEQGNQGQLAQDSSRDQALGPASMLTFSLDFTKTPRRHRNVRKISSPLQVLATALVSTIVATDRLQTVETASLVSITSLEDRIGSHQPVKTLQNHLYTTGFTSGPKRTEVDLVINPSLWLIVRNQLLDPSFHGRFVTIQAT